MSLCTDSSTDFSSSDRVASKASILLLNAASGGLAGKTFTFTDNAEEPKTSCGSCWMKVAEEGACLLEACKSYCMSHSRTHPCEPAGPYELWTVEHTECFTDDCTYLRKNFKFCLVELPL